MKKKNPDVLVVRWSRGWTLMEVIHNFVLPTRFLLQRVPLLIQRQKKIRTRRTVRFAEFRSRSLD